MRDHTTLSTSTDKSLTNNWPTTLCILCIIFFCLNIFVSFFLCVCLSLCHSLSLSLSLSLSVCIFLTHFIIFPSHRISEEVLEERASALTTFNAIKQQRQDCRDGKAVLPNPEAYWERRSDPSPNQIIHQELTVGVKDEYTDEIRRESIREMQEGIEGPALKTASSTNM